jgi:glycine cleavage system H lipoate-binding protein
MNDRNLTDNITGDSKLPIVVGRNVVIPVINPDNPYFVEISRKGFSPEKMKIILESAKISWGDILDGKQENKISVNYLSDQVVIESLAGFTGSGPEKIRGKGYSSGIDLLGDIGRDIYSIGFCRLSDLQSPAAEALSGKISILAIDKNSNGTIDSNEDIYSDMQAFNRGVWIGKYPKELYNNILSVTETPVTKNVASFLNWIITDGQESLSAEGFTGLILTERISYGGKLAEAMVGPSPDTGGPNIFRSFVIVLLILCAGIFITGFIVRFRKKKTVITTIMTNSGGQVLDEKSILLPKGVYFDKTHTWAFMEQDGNVKVGIDDFLLHLTGKITRLRIKKAGDRVKKGDEILTIVNSGKQLRLYSPVSGVIKELNAGLESNVELINSAPYSNGWVYRVEPDNWQRENQLLFMADKHRQFIQNEIAKIRDFLASLLHNENMQVSPLILQDGGTLRQGILSEMGPEAWEEFQTRIIDPSRTVWFYEII